MMADDITFREAEADDWTEIGRITGRTPAEAAALRRDLQRDYDPWFALVAETGAPDGAAGRPGGATGRSDGAAQRVVGTVVAGSPRSTAGGAEQGTGRAARILWIEVLPSF